MFFCAIDSGNLRASSSATSSLVSIASMIGVSSSTLWEMPSFSWPESIRNAFVGGHQVAQSLKDVCGRERETGMGWMKRYIPQLAEDRALRRGEAMCCPCP